MTNQKRGVFGLASFLAGLIALAFFNETVASFLEETKLNRSWTLVQPGLQWLASMVRLLIHPVLTHSYAFIGGMVVATLGLLISAARQTSPSKADMISLPEVVEYLTMETAWAKGRLAVTDQAVMFELMDVLAAGRLKAYAREVNWGQPSALRRISPSYFHGVVIDVAAIRQGGRNQIAIRTGYNGDHFEYWQFERKDVQAVWPKPKESRKNWSNAR